MLPVMVGFWLSGSTGASILYDLTFSITWDSQSCKICVLRKCVGKALVLALDSLFLFSTKLRRGTVISAFWLSGMLIQMEKIGLYAQCYIRCTAPAQLSYLSTS